MAVSAEAPVAVGASPLAALASRSLAAFRVTSAAWRLPVARDRAMSTSSKSEGQHTHVTTSQCLAWHRSIGRYTSEYCQKIGENKLVSFFENLCQINKEIIKEEGTSNLLYDGVRLGE